MPVPEDDWGYMPDEVAARQPLRPASNPVDLTQAGGPGYAITGSRIEWDIWRSVLYQAHLSEVFVPYMDPSAGWYFRTYMDSGEYGFGLFLSPLRAGIDCPGHAHLLAGARQRRPGPAAGDSGRHLRVRALHR